ncbi:tripartite tricarboxylate transporter substrate binding protein [soil metagenome]
MDWASAGEPDRVARSPSPFLKKHLGGNANFVIANRAGASGEIGNAHLARAAADGYTIGVVNVPPLLFVPLTKKAQYDPKDLTLLARVVSDPTVIIGRKDGSYHSLKQVVDALKAKPGSISVGYNGVGTNGHVAMLQLQNATGIQLNDIPFKGTSESKTALYGAHIDLMFASFTAIADADKEAVPIDILAQFMEQRAPALKNVPTSREQGIDVVMPSDRGFAVPKGTPAEIRTRLERAIEAGMKDPEFLKVASSFASVLSYAPGTEWQKQLDAGMPALEAIARKFKAE